MFLNLPTQGKIIIFKRALPSHLYKVIMPIVATGYC